MYKAGFLSDSIREGKSTVVCFGLLQQSAFQVAFLKKGSGEGVVLVQYGFGIGVLVLVADAVDGFVFGDGCSFNFQVQILGFTGVAEEYEK